MSRSASPLTAPGLPVLPAAAAASRATPPRPLSDRDANRAAHSPRVPSPHRAASPARPNGAENAARAEQREKDKDREKQAYEYVACSQRRTGRDKIQYHLTVMQEPAQARMCGVGDKPDRRPIDPTPIVQLVVIDENGEDATSSGRPPTTFMQNPYYFLYACLIKGEDDGHEKELHLIDDNKTRYLTGTPVSSLFHLKDPNNREAAYFVFPDMGVRKEGLYRLKMTLFEIVDHEVYFCTTTNSNTFYVSTAKRFKGMLEIPPLSRHLADQGLKVRVRKDSRPAGRRAKRKSEQSEDEASKRSRSNATPGAYPGMHPSMPPPPHPMAQYDYGGRPLSSPQYPPLPRGARMSMPATYDGRPHSASYPPEAYGRGTYLPPPPASRSPPRATPQAAYGPPPSQPGAVYPPYHPGYAYSGPPPPAGYGRALPPGQLVPAILPPGPPGPPRSAGPSTGMPPLLPPVRDHGDRRGLPDRERAYLPDPRALPYPPPTKAEPHDGYPPFPRPDGRHRPYEHDPRDTRNGYRDHREYLARDPHDARDLHGTHVLHDTRGQPPVADARDGRAPHANGHAHPGREQQQHDPPAPLRPTWATANGSARGHTRAPSPAPPPNGRARAPPERSRPASPPAPPPARSPPPRQPLHVDARDLPDPRETSRPSTAVSQASAMRSAPSGSRSPGTPGGAQPTRRMGLGDLLG